MKGKRDCERLSIGAEICEQIMHYQPAVGNEDPESVHKLGVTILYTLQDSA